MEENFSMEWKIFSIKWKSNGRKLPAWNMEKSSSFSYHALIIAMEPNGILHIFEDKRNRWNKVWGTSLWVHDN